MQMTLKTKYQINANISRNIFVWNDDKYKYIVFDDKICVLALNACAYAVKWTARVTLTAHHVMM